MLTSPDEIRDKSGVRVQISQPFERAREARMANAGAARREGKRRFLEALSKGGSISRAAVVARVGRQTVRDWRRDDPEFRAAWDAAEAASLDSFEDVIALAGRQDWRASLAYLQRMRPDIWAKRARRKESVKAATNSATTAPDATFAAMNAPGIAAADGEA